MKLELLEVESFGRIDHASIAFGDGLNVLHGPNDLGKSTLVKAIRAALLLPANYKPGRDFEPWEGVGQPTVTLTFEVEREGLRRHYRVRKVFGAQNEARLEESRDGESWSRMASGREVDAKLRSDVLRWGIAGPGEAGVGHGYPDSFLANVLITDQSAVDNLLREVDLSKDTSDSARDWLNNLLEAAAIDPFFRRVMEQVEVHYGEAFSPTGRERRNADAPLMRMRDRINKLKTEIEDKAQRSADLEGRRQELGLLVKEQQDVDQQAEDAKVALNLARAQAETRKRRAEARTACEVADTALAAARARGQRHTALATEHRFLEGVIENDVQRWLQAAQKAVATAAQEVDAAKTAHDQSRNTPETRDGALRESELQTTLVEARAALEQFERTLEQARGAKKAIAERDATLKTVTELETAYEAAQKALTAVAARQAENAAATHLHTCRSLALEQRALTLEAQAVDQDVERRKTRDQGLAETATTIDAEALALDQRPLPDAERVDGVRRLHTQLREAQAAAAVGVGVQLSPTQPLTVSVTRDDAAAETLSIAAPTTLEAAGTLRLTIDGVGTLEVSAGSAEQRADATALRNRWRDEGQPVLDAANVSDLDVLIRAVRQRDEARDQLAQRRATLKAAQAAAAAEPPIEASQQQLAERRSALTAQLAQLEADAPADVDSQALVADAARRWETLDMEGVEDAEDALFDDGDALATAAKTTARLLAEAQQEVRDLATRLEAKREALGSARARCDALDPSLIEGWQEVLATETERQAALTETVTGLTKQLETLQSQRDLAVDAAKQAHVDAEQRLEATKLRAKRVSDGAASLREARVAAETRLDRVRADVAQDDLDALQAQATQRAEALAALSPPANHQETPGADGAPDAEELERTLHGLLSQRQSLSEDVAHVRGQVEQGGGPSAHETLAALRERRRQIEAQEAELEREYNGWKLLREVMVSVQESRASHLGNALAPAVTETFQALAQRPYGLAVNNELDAAGTIQVAGAARKLDQVSVGTREQLATVYRLSLAQQLGSVVILDDQLVQSDAGRMTGLRRILSEVSAAVQVVVFTCRPEDYAPVDGARVVDLEPMLSASVGVVAAGSDLAGSDVA